jgi:hypothetical protein
MACEGVCIFVWNPSSGSLLHLLRKGGTRLLYLRCVDST